VRCAGIEGTSSYGAGLARHLKASGISVMELERPERRHLRRKGKSPIPSTRRQRPGQCWLARLSESLRAATDEWR
jgi:hypothetical protein